MLIFFLKSMKISVLKHFKIFTAIENHFDLIKSSGSFLEVPKTFSHPESDSKISTLVITELFYSHKKFQAYALLWF